jgi:hypothetical protein
MAAKHLVSMLHLVTTTGVSQTTLSTLTASGISREFPEFASADAAVFYIDCSAGTGTTPTLQFSLTEQDPATGVFFAPPTTEVPVIPLIQTTAITPATTGFRFTIDPCFGACYQLNWVITGTTPSYSASVVAQLISRGR